LVYVVVCRCVRFGICSGAAPAGFGIDHPVSGGRHLAGHYPFCVSLSVRAVTCTRRVACLVSSALRACALSIWGDMGVRACVRAASARASCLWRVRACAAWRPLSLLRGVAPVRAASLRFPQRLVVSSFYWRSTFVGYVFGSSLCLVTSFGASMPVGPMPAGPMPAGPMPAGPMPAGPMPAGPMPAGPMPAGPMPAGPMPVGPKAVGPLGTSQQGTVQAIAVAAIPVCGWRQVAGGVLARASSGSLICGFSVSDFGYVIIFRHVPLFMWLRRRSPKLLRRSPLL
jgi:hypothetical protein